MRLDKDSRDRAEAEAYEQVDREEQQAGKREVHWAAIFDLQMRIRYLIHVMLQAKEHIPPQQYPPPPPPPPAAAVTFSPASTAILSSVTTPTGSAWSVCCTSTTSTSYPSSLSQAALLEME